MASASRYSASASSSSSVWAADLSPASPLCSKSTLPRLFIDLIVSSCPLPSDARRPASASRRRGVAAASSPRYRCRLPRLLYAASVDG